MKIDLRTHGLKATPELRRDVEHEVQRATRRFAEHVSGVFVRLTDINGTKGGPDIHCTMLATLRGLPPVLVETRPLNLLTAIDVGARKLERAVTDAIDRRKPRRWAPSLTLEVG